MLKNWKLLVLDASIVVLNIFVFNNFIEAGFTFGRIILATLCVGGSVAAHFGGYHISDIQEEKRIAEANRARFKTEDEQFKDYMEQLRKLQHSESSFAGVISRFTHQVEAFNDKADSLIRIIQLNNGAAEAFLVSRNDEVRKVLFKNLKKFVKRLIVYSAKSKNNRADRVENDPEVQKILKNNDELLDLYDQLLEEVAKMGDDFNIDDSGLQFVIESLKEMRSGEDDEDDDDGITLQIRR